MVAEALRHRPDAYDSSYGSASVEAGSVERPESSAEWQERFERLLGRLRTLTVINTALATIALAALLVDAVWTHADERSWYGLLACSVLAVAAIALAALGTQADRVGQRRRDAFRKKLEETIARQR